MAECECPIDGCDFTGPLKSVEAHISGSASGGHEGETGRGFREKLREQIESRLNGGGDSEESDDGSDESEASDADSEGGEPDDLPADPSAPESGSVATSVAAAPALLGAGLFGASDGSGFNREVLLVVGIVVVLGLLLMSSGSSEGSEEGERSEESSEGAEEVRVCSSGGVVDG